MPRRERESEVSAELTKGHSPAVSLGFSLFRLHGGHWFVLLPWVPHFHCACKAMITNVKAEAGDHYKYNTKSEVNLHFLKKVIPFNLTHKVTLNDTQHRNSSVWNLKMTEADFVVIISTVALNSLVL